MNAQASEAETQVGLTDLTQKDLLIGDLTVAVALLTDKAGAKVTLEMKETHMKTVIVSTLLSQSLSLIAASERDAETVLVTQEGAAVLTRVAIAGAVAIGVAQDLSVQTVAIDDTESTLVSEASIVTKAVTRESTEGGIDAPGVKALNPGVLTSMTESKRVNNLSKLTKRLGLMLKKPIKLQRLAVTSIGDAFSTAKL